MATPPWSRPVPVARSDDRTDPATRPYQHATPALAPRKWGSTSCAARGTRPKMQTPHSLALAPSLKQMRCIVLGATMPRARSATRWSSSSPGCSASDRPTKSDPWSDFRRAHTVRGMRTLDRSTRHRSQPGPSKRCLITLWGAGLIALAVPDFAGAATQGNDVSSRPAPAESRTGVRSDETTVDGDAGVEAMFVYGRADRQIGVAAAASEGRVGGADLALRPIGRVGELLEAIPGLIATQHSGPGKSNQLFLRGFNLDHGTDFAAPKSKACRSTCRTHGHGHGYTRYQLLDSQSSWTSIEFQKGVVLRAIRRRLRQRRLVVRFQTLRRQSPRTRWPRSKIGADSIPSLRGRGDRQKVRSLARLLLAVEFVQAPTTIPWTKPQDLREVNAGMARYSWTRRARRRSAGRCFGARLRHAPVDIVGPDPAAPGGSTVRSRRLDSDSTTTTSAASRTRVQRCHWQWRQCD